MAWVDRQAELIDALELGLVDRAHLLELADRDLHDLIGAARRAAAPPKDLRSEQSEWIVKYFQRFARPERGGRDAVRTFQAEICRYQGSSWRTDNSSFGPPPTVRGGPKEFFWEILALGIAPPLERTLQTLYARAMKPAQKRP